MEQYPHVNFLFIPYFREPSSVQKPPLSLRHLLSILAFHLVNNNQWGIDWVFFESYMHKTQPAHKDSLFQKNMCGRWRGALARTGWLIYSAIMLWNVIWDKTMQKMLKFSNCRKSIWKCLFGFVKATTCKVT